MTIQTTVNEFAAKNAPMESADVRALFNLLVACKAAKIVGTKPANSPNGKGRGSHIYEIPTSYTFNFE